jgi:hypothetical protein
MLDTTIAVSIGLTAEVQPPERKRGEPLVLTTRTTGRRVTPSPLAGRGLPTSCAGEGALRPDPGVGGRSWPRSRSPSLDDRAGQRQPSMRSRDGIRGGAWGSRRGCPARPRSTSEARSPNSWSPSSGPAWPRSTRPPWPSWLRRWVARSQRSGWVCVGWSSSWHRLACHIGATGNAVPLVPAAAQAKVAAQLARPDQVPPLSQEQRRCWRS